MEPARKIFTTCCIAGGGPAGMMLGFLLGRAGVNVTVLEKHGDFLRDFRGDTVHPSTLQVMYELGLLDEFLKIPHQKLTRIAGQIGEVPFTVADFSHLPTHCKFIALMPQWNFLNFLADHGDKYPSFHLRMRYEATDLIHADGRIVGVRAQTPHGDVDIRAHLVVVADGRRSVLRQQSGLPLIDYGAPMDVFWMRISRREDDPGQTLGYIRAGKLLVMLDRGSYWQCGMVIPKGGAEAIRHKGLDEFQRSIREVVPFVGERMRELKSWDDIKLLSVQVNRLQRWHLPGCLFIGDAAHAMSPIGGVGINLAIQDAVAAANELVIPLLDRTVTEETLSAIQRRRETPVRLIQRLQTIIQNYMFKNVLSAGNTPAPPLPINLLRRWPLLRRLPARVIGMGFRPEHVRTAELAYT
jgi:2-polyprenyl-6-methoxyphenol hydroxylase-like FAD-dependent oxidoreductase